MSPRLLTVLIAATVLLAPARAALAAPAPANVTVRVEGAAATLLPRTAVTTSTALVNKDGIAGHDCSGTSAAGALETATGGGWSGSWFGASGYFVDTILGEAHVFPDPDYFTLWINDHEATEGICGASSELQSGDDVLFFVAHCDSDPVTYACTNPPVLPLGLAAPSLVRPGAPFDVHVVVYAADGTSSPVAGATVAGGGGSATTNAAGVATLTLATLGRTTLKATLAGDARSDAAAVCVSTTTSACTTSVTGGDVATPCTPPSDGHDGRCGTRDTDAPRSAIVAITEGQRFSRAKAPRTLQATVDPDPSGLLAVKLRLTRTDGRHCTYFSGGSERFKLGKQGRCGASNGFWFGVGDRQQTSYLLPSKLPRGRYVLDVEAIDKAYNRDDVRRRGVNRIVFHVA